MSSAALTVKPPLIAGTRVGSAMRLDRPLSIGLPPVLLPDGTPAAQVEAGAVLYRVGEQGEQVWNAAANAWAPDPGEAALGSALPLLPLAPGSDPALPWSAGLSAPPPLDADGRPQLEAAAGEHPKYFARALVTAHGGGKSWRALSAASPALALAQVQTLALPAPSLVFKGAGPLAPIEAPVQIGLPALTLPDGSAVTADDVVTLGVFIYRADGLWWDESAQRWQAPPPDLDALAAHKPLALTLQPGQSPPWQGQLAASGQQDQDGAPRFAPVGEGGGPYRLRAFAHLRRDGVVYLGLGAPAPDLLFARTSGQERFRIEFDTDSAQDCTRATLRLADAGGSLAARITLRAAERDLELATLDGAGNVRATLRLTADGDIELAPAPGRRLLALADLECERIRYRPAGGGLKQDLG